MEMKAARCIWVVGFRVRRPVSPLFAVLEARSPDVEGA